MNGTKLHMNFHIAVSGANVVPVLAVEAGNFLAENQLRDENIVTAARMVASIVSPVSDIRSRAEYRKDMVYQLTKQALINTLKKLKVEVHQ